MRRRVWSDSEAAVPRGAEAPEVLRRDTRYRRTLAGADVVSAALAVYVGVSLIGDDTLRPAIVLTLPLIVLVSKTMGLYDRDEHLLRKTTLDEAPALFQLATLYALIIWLGEDELFVYGDLGRDQVLGLWMLLFVAMLTARSSGRYIARVRSGTERCLVVGDDQVARMVQRKLSSSMSANAVVVGRVPLPSDRRRIAGRPPNGRERRVVSGLPSLGTLDTLGLVLVDHEINRAIIAPSVATSDQVFSVADEMLDVIRLVRSLGVKVSVLPRLFEVIGSSVELDDVEGMTLLGLRPDGLTKSSLLLKRAMDLVGAGLGLVVLWPVLAAVAVAVRVSSPGPVLFRQKRIGRDGTEFSMLKFRTMVEGAEDRKSDFDALNEAAEGLFKIANDPRLTCVGCFLRRMSLDELPQLINVLRGEMSLVGPRPLVPEEDQRIEGWARRRLHAPPGMTGVWQVFGSSRIPLSEMVKIDYLYCANWSLWLDVKILLQTIPHTLGRRGV